MHNSYEDIIILGSELGKEPIWWDENAVPRYCQFHPKEVANIYASEVCLLLIECQGCQFKFKVAMCFDKHHMIMNFIRLSFLSKGLREEIDKFSKDSEAYDKVCNDYSLKNRIVDKTIHYGDPPNYDKCCASGATMNCIDLRVLEYWTKDGQHNWVRDNQYEIWIAGGYE